MKSKRLLDAFNLIDEKYIDEASPDKRRANNKKRWIKFTAIAACICLMITAINLFLFIPFSTEVPDVSEYSDSQYYEIIKGFNALSAIKPKYKNNFDKIISSFSSIGGIFDKNEDVDFDASAPEDSGTNGDYTEITDNQVEGVIEGDLIKRSDKYIYYLTGSRLKIYSLDKELSKLVSDFDYSTEFYKATGYTVAGHQEMYLSRDCSFVTVISTYYSNEYSFSLGTAVISIDVRDATRVLTNNYKLIDGTLKTSRLTENGLLVITNKSYSSVDFSKEESFVPGIYDGGKDEKSLIPMDNILCPEKITSKIYTVVSLINECDLELVSTAGFLAYSGDIYVTNNAIYTTNGKDVDISEGGYKKTKSATEIACIAYGKDGFDIKGKVTVDGYIKDRYSLDEYNGILRVVTTTQSFVSKHYSFSGNESFTIDTSEGTSASLYCIDLASWKIVASVEKFAPKGETVRSVRFDKGYAYVCTAIQLTDPVFFFDLNDINNITYKETGNIEGFSTSLINLGKGYLLGIGRGDSWNTVKIEVYMESESAVISVCSYVIENASYSLDYKSYYIDRKNQLFGFGYTDYGPSYSYSSSKYMLLLFNNGQLTPIVNTTLNGDNTVKRCVYIDGYIYLFSNEEFKVIGILNQ